MTAAERKARMLSHWGAVCESGVGFGDAIAAYGERLLADPDIRSPRCRCGHARGIHSMGPRNVCAAGKCRCQQFQEGA